MQYVFTDLGMKCVFTTKDYAQTFTRQCGLPFTPKTVSINPNNVNHILAFDEEAPDSPVNALILVLWPFVSHRVFLCVCVFVCVCVCVLTRQLFV